MVWMTPHVPASGFYATTAYTNATPRHLVPTERSTCPRQEAGITQRRVEVMFSGSSGAPSTRLHGAFDSDLSALRIGPAPAASPPVSYMTQTPVARCLL